MSELPTKVSESVRKRNPHLYGTNKSNPSVQQIVDAVRKANPRLKQDHKPLMNKLETEYFKQLQRRPLKGLRAQARRYKLGNGIWFKVDITAWDETGRECAWEVKGPKSWRGGFENLKVAAALWPEVRWVLAWKEQGAWREQIVLP